MSVPSPTSLQPNTTSRGVKNSASDFDPAFSPDGSKIAFATNRDSNNFEVYVMNVNGINQTRLTNTDLFVRDDQPTYSPDGSKIAFRRNLEVYVMNSDGTNPVRLTNNTAIDGRPDWQPNTAPTVKPLSPKPGSSTEDRTPTIRAIVRDAQTDLASSNLRLFLDGEPIKNFSYDQDTDRLRFTLREDLTFRGHAVSIVARDDVRLVGRKSWSFSVVR